MREVPPLERALLGALIALAVFLCAHAIGGCAHHTDVGRGTHTAAAAIAEVHSSALAGSTAPVFPPDGNALASAELLRSKAPGPLVDARDAHGPDAGERGPEAGPGARKSAAGESPAPLSRHAAGDRRSDPSERSSGAGSGVRPQLFADELVLVHVALAEARWRQADRAPLWHVLARWARRYGLSLERAAQWRVWQHSRPPRWVRRVQLDCDEPSGWPERYRWQRDRCAELLADARAFLRGELDHPCPAALGWRAPGDALLAALAAGRKRVSCGATANRFVR